MKAMVLINFGSSLELRDLEVAKIGSDEALVRVRASGICHTDLKVQAGLVPTVKTPRVMGHEIAGEIAETQADETNFHVGDHVAVYPYVTCGLCYACRTARENLCVNLFKLGRIGYERDGGYAEFVKVPVRNLCKLAASLSFEEAAVVPDAVVVMLHAIRNHVE